MTNHFKKLPFFIMISLFCLCIGVSIWKSKASPLQKQDYQRIKSESYDTVFLSMFPIQNYETEPFLFYRGQTLLRLEYNLPNLNTLQDYLAQITASGNAVSCIYLGIRPELLPADKLFSLLQKYPDIQFQIILPYPVIDYWKELSSSEFSKEAEAYRTLSETLSVAANCSVYLFGDRWIICNPANYTDTFVTTTDISFTLMMNCDYLHPFLLTADNMEERFSVFFSLLEKERSAPASYPNLSDAEIVFFGDSIIGLYTDSSSIPGVVNGLTNARVYNLGYGGNTAAYDGNGITLPGIVNSFIQKELSPLPKDAQVYQGMKDYLSAGSNVSPFCFVINYGLNDYIRGLPVTSEDPYDIQTYAGALRTAVKALQDHFPNAKIILMTPNYTIYTDKPAAGIGEYAPLIDYVQTVRAIAAETNVMIADNFTDLGINIHNVEDYLSDGVHPNAATRFVIAEHIIRILE